MFRVFGKLFAVLLVILSLSGCQLGGAPISPNVAQSVRNASPGSAFIFRDSGLYGAAVNMDIHIDGNLVGKVGNKRVLEFQIPRSSKSLEVGMSSSSEPGRNTIVLDLQPHSGKPRFFLVTGDLKIIPLVVVTIVETGQYLIEVDQQTFLAQL